MTTQPAPGPPSLLPRRRRRFGGTESGGRAALVAAGSTVVVGVVVAWWISRSAAWPAVRAQFFDWEKMQEVAPAIVAGFWLDIRMFAVAEVLILLFALLLAVIRALRGPAFFPLRALVVVYIDIMRGIPLILLILLLGFGVPALQLPGVPRSPLFWGVTALVLSYSAYTAEVYRAGIESVHESQRMAARSLGLSQWEALRYVVIPPAVRNVIPALLNGLVSLQKDVALVVILGVREAVREAQIFTARSFNYSGYVVAAVLFLIISIPVARFADWYTERDRERRYGDRG